MPLDPFAALGIDQSALPPPPSAIAGFPQPSADQAPPKKGGVDPFAALGVDTSQQYAPTPVQPKTVASAGVGQNFAAGANRTIFSALGAPVDLATAGLNLGARGLGLSPIQEPVGGSDWLNRQWSGLTGVNPQQIKPQNEAERMAAASGGAVAQIPLLAAGGAAAEAALPETATGSRAVAQAVQQGSGPSSVVPVAVGGAAGQLAEDKAPEPLKPLANLSGNLAGAGLAGVGQETASFLGGKAASAAGRLGIGAKEDIGGVHATPAQAAAAGGQVEQALGQQGVQTLQNAPDELVPGSQPTTAQVAQTPGAATLEKAHRVATPEPFLQRAQEQNMARLGAVQSLAPESANPASIGQLFQQRLDALDQQGQQGIQAARQNVQQATDTLGGTQTTGAYGDQARAALQAAKAPVTAQTRALWQAVDPDGTWALPAPVLRDTAQQLTSEISPTAQTDAQETALLQRSASLPDVVRFQDLGGIRADINAAMRRLSGTPGYEPNVRRLTILKNSVDTSIQDALNGRAQQEAQAVATGQMEPEQTLQAGLQRAQQGWYAARNATAAQAGAAGGSNGPGTFPNAGMGQAAISGARGAESQAGGRFANAAGSQGLSGQIQPVEPNLTPEHAAAYNAAVNGTREEKQTFGLGGVGQVLRPGKQGADYAVESGNVLGKIFTRGPTEPQEVERFINAVGGPEQAAQIGRETLANELRQQNIIKPDGTIDQNRFATWQAKRQATIQQFPGLGDQFANAESAQRTLDDVSAAHKAAVDEFNRSAAARFINNDPSKAVASAFGSANPSATFRQLVQQVRGNADAEGGLKRAVVDYLVEKTRSATPGEGEQDMLKPAVFRNWIRQNSGPLKALFGGQGVQNLDMVAADIRRAAQASSATGGSDTAANIAAAKKTGLAKSGHAASGTILTLLGEHLGEHLQGGLGGAAVGAVALPVLGHLVSSMRQAGIHTINDLVREAMLHPQLARELVARSQANKIGPVAAQRIARALQTSVLANSTQEDQRQ